MSESPKNEDARSLNVANHREKLEKSWLLAVDYSDIGGPGVQAQAASSSSSEKTC